MRVDGTWTLVAWLCALVAALFVYAVTAGGDRLDVQTRMPPRAYVHPDYDREP